MARIVAYTSSAPAHWYPFVPLLKELKGRGHKVRLNLFTTERRRVDAEGVPVQQSIWPGRGSAYSTSPVVIGREYFLEPLAKHFASLIEAEFSDMMIIDPMLWGGMIACEASGRPWATLSHNPYTIRGCGVDVRGPGDSPALSPFQHILKRLKNAGLLRAEGAVLRACNQVRAKMDLPPMTRLSEAYQRAPLTIATTAEPFEYPRSDWPSTYTFVGPLLWEPQIRSSQAEPKPGAKPLVLVTDSTIPRSAGAKEWVGEALEALRATGTYQVVATVPGHRAQPGADNVHLHSFLPHSAILNRAACVLCHGGSGITHKALAFGVPVVAIPDGLDRFEVARRVEVAEAGVMLPIDRFTAPRMLSALAAAMRMRPGAERMRDAFRDAGGAPRAADAVEGLLKGLMSDLRTPPES